MVLTEEMMTPSVDNLKLTVLAEETHTQTLPVPEGIFRPPREAQSFPVDRKVYVRYQTSPIQTSRRRGPDFFPPRFVRLPHCSLDDNLQTPLRRDNRSVSGEIFPENTIRGYLSYFYKGSSTTLPLHH